MTARLQYVVGEAVLLQDSFTLEYPHADLALVNRHARVYFEVAVELVPRLEVFAADCAHAAARVAVGDVDMLGQMLWQLILFDALTALVPLPSVDFHGADPPMYGGRRLPRHAEPSVGNKNVTPTKGREADAVSDDNRPAGAMV